MKGLRAWQGFYLDLQRRILKRRFSERPDCSTPGSAVSKCWQTMNGTLSSDHIFLPFYLQNYYRFLNRALNRASTGPIDAFTLVITKELPSSPQRVLNQANNEPLHPNPHPLGQRSTQAGMLRVKELAYQSPSNHRTHKTPCRTTSHLEDISGTAKREGGFLRSSELWDGTPELP